MTDGVYVLSCRLTSGPLWLGIYLLLWWFLLVLFGLFLLHWRYELPCQDKLPEFHCTPILGCIRVLWLVFHPLGLGLDKALCGWNSVTDKVVAAGRLADVITMASVVDMFSVVATEFGGARNLQKKWLTIAQEIQRRP